MLAQAPAAYAIGFLSGCGAASNLVKAGVQAASKRMNAPLLPCGCGGGGGRGDGEMRGGGQRAGSEPGSEPGREPARGGSLPAAAAPTALVGFIGTHKPPPRTKRRLALASSGAAHHLVAVVGR